MCISVLTVDPLTVFPNRQIQTLFTTQEHYCFIEPNEIPCLFVQMNYVCVDVLIYDRHCRIAWECRPRVSA